MNMPSGNSTLCSGPLATNTTCCYCYISRDDEEYDTKAIREKYWSCAVARNNSLLPLNLTRINTQGKRVAWITGRFGNADYFEHEIKGFCRDIRNLNFFEPQDVYCFWQSPDYALQNPKFHRHLQYRNDPKDLSAKGGGYWFHKSVLIRHHLDLYSEGDLLVYTDLDRTDFFLQGTLHAMLETMAARGDDLSIEFMGPSPEAVFTKEDVLAAFNASHYIRRSPQVLANAIVVRNSPTMKLFTDAWVDCVSDWHMVSDEPSVLPNAPNCGDHRHDQSILSVLIKTFMTKQAVVGPPARAYIFTSEIATYKFEKGAEPACPFAAFYEEKFKTHFNGTT